MIRGLVSSTPLDFGPTPHAGEGRRSLKTSQTVYRRHAITSAADLSEAVAKLAALLTGLQLGRQPS